MTRIIKILLLLACLNLLPDSATAKSYEELWEMDENQLRKMIPGKREFSYFDPNKQLEYKNRIFSLFTSMGINQEYLNIMRLHGYPMIDFMFYRGKLYSATEDWRNAKNGDLDKLKTDLQKRYGQPETAGRDDLTIYTYKKDRTVVILYSRKNDNLTSRCKVYYYSKKIFNRLFAE